MTRIVSVNITGDVQIDEQEIERLMAEGKTENEAIQEFAQAQAMLAIPSDEFMKERDTIVLLSSIRNNE